MKTLLIMTVSIVGMLREGHAQTLVTTGAVNYSSMQREVRANAHKALVSAYRAEHGARMVGQAEASMKESVAQALQSSSTLLIQLPYETFNSPEGILLIRNITRLASLQHEMNRADFAKLPPELLRKIQGVCEEMAE